MCKLSLNYRNTKTYKYKMPKYEMDAATAYSMRSEGQTLFLYQLVDGDFDILMFLEMAIKKQNISYCPDSHVEVSFILSSYLDAFDDKIIEYYINKLF